MVKKIIKALLLGIAAGAAISLGGFFFILCKSFIPNYGLIIGALCFPVGLLIVCYFSLFLYTGKIGFIFRSDNKKDALLDLGVMLIGNIIGAMMCGLICYALFNNNQSIMECLHATAAAKTKDLVSNVWFASGCFVILKGMGCGAFVYLAVLAYKKFKHHIFKILGIFVCIFAFVALSLEHCIANAFYFAFNFDFANPGIYLNFIYAAIGNSLGAIVLDRIIAFFKFTLTYKKD